MSMKFSPDSPDAIKEVNDLLSYITKDGDNISLSPEQILANYLIIDDLEKQNQSDHVPSRDQCRMC